MTRCPPSSDDAFPALATLRASLDSLDASALRRVRRTTHCPSTPHTRVGADPLLAFASNDYLGLAAHPQLIDAVAEGAARWGVGAGASHLVCGHSAAHEAVEDALARFTGFPRSLLFSTGYLANLAVMPALIGRSGTIFADRLNHASLVDGALLSRAVLQRYPHNDLATLERLLAESKSTERLIVSDAVFSMDGDIAPLASLLALAQRYDAWLLIDDAHGFGVLGPQGRGSLAEAGLQSDRLILMGTLGKAAGVAGAFIAAHATVIEWLIQRARPYIYTTAMPPLLAHVLLHALALVEQANDRRQRLNDHIATLRKRIGSCLLPSRTPIQPFVLGDNDVTLRLAEALRREGLWVPAIRPPTVPAGSARLRISLSAAHTDADLDQLIAALLRHAPEGRT